MIRYEYYGYTYGKHSMNDVLWNDEGWIAWLKGQLEESLFNGGNQE